VAKARDGVGACVRLLAGVSPGKLACPLRLGVSEARRWGDRASITQVVHFAVLRTEAGCSISVALGLQPFAVGELGRAQIGMFTQRVRGRRRGGFLLGAARRGVAF